MDNEWTSDSWESELTRFINEMWERLWTVTSFVFIDSLCIFMTYTLAHYSGKTSRKSVKVLFVIVCVIAYGVNGNISIYAQEKI